MIRPILLFIFLTALGAEEYTPFDGTPSFEADDTITWADEGPSVDQIRNFCQVNLDYERIFFSKFSDAPFLENKIGYAEGNILMSYTRFLCKTAAINGGMGYNHTALSWADNPYFTQEDYDFISFNINGFTYIWDGDIVLKGGASANIDTRHWSLTEYTYYMLTGWGRYAWDTCLLGEIGLNLGATGRVGLGNGFIAPIFGVDFELWDNVKVNLIFPIDMAVIYKVNECWSFAVTGRIWNSKRRWGADEPISRGYWEYKNRGIDFGIQYEWDPIAAINIHVGGTFGDNRIRISNGSDMRIGEFRFNSAPYAGGEVWFRF